MQAAQTAMKVSGGVDRAMGQATAFAKPPPAAVEEPIWDKWFALFDLCDVCIGVHITTLIFYVSWIFSALFWDDRGKWLGIFFLGCVFHFVSATATEMVKSRMTTSNGSGPGVDAIIISPWGGSEYYGKSVGLRDLSGQVKVWAGGLVALFVCALIFIILAAASGGVSWGPAYPVSTNVGKNIFSTAMVVCFDMLFLNMTVAVYPFGFAQILASHLSVGNDSASKIGKLMVGESFVAGAFWFIIGCVNRDWFLLYSSIWIFLQVFLTFRVVNGGFFHEHPFLQNVPDSGLPTALRSNSNDGHMELGAPSPDEELGATSAPPQTVLR